MNTSERFQPAGFQPIYDEVQKKLRETGRAIVIGSPGVGKTFLGKKIAEAETDRNLVFDYQFTPDYNDNLVAILRDLAKFLAERGNSEPLDRFEAYIESHREEKVPSSVREVIVGGLRNKKYLLCFDDVHHILASLHREDLLQLFRVFTNQLGTTRLLLLGREALPDDIALERVYLKGLSLEEFIPLLRQECADYPVNDPAQEPDEALIRKVEQETLGKALWCKLGGNPQYLLLFIQSIAGKPKDAASVRGYLKDLSSTAEVGGYLLGQIRDQLTNEAQKVCCAASIFRRPAEVSLVLDILSESRILPADVSVWDILQALNKRRGLLSLEGERVHLHDIIKEFWSSALQEPDRSTLHCSVCTVWERDPSRLPAIEAAYHYFESRQPERAFDLLRERYDELLGGGQAGALLAQLKRFGATHFPERVKWVNVLLMRGRVERHLGRYEDAVKSHGDAQREAREADLRELQIRALVELGRDNMALGKYKRAVRALQEAQRLADERVPAGLRGRIACTLGLAYANLKSYKEALESVEPGVSLLKEAGNYRELIRAYDLLVEIHNALGKPDEAWAALDEADALAVMEGLTDSPEMARIYGHRAFRYVQMSEPGQARKYLEQALAIGERTGELDQVIQDAANLGIIAYMKGDSAEAERRLRQAVELAEKIQSARWFLNAFNLANLWQEQGRWDEAFELMQRMERNVVTVDDRARGYLMQAHIGHNRALLARAEGRAEEAERLWEEAWKLLEKPLRADEGGEVDPEIALEMEMLRAEMRAVRGRDLDAALSEAQKALKATLPREDREQEGAARRTLGVVHAARGEWAKADEAFAQALECFGAGTKSEHVAGAGTGEEHVSGVARTYYHQGRRYAAEGKVEEARRAFEQSIALYEKMAVEGHESDCVRLVKATQQLSAGE